MMAGRRNDTDTGRVHELKVVAPYFDALVSGAKTFEVRKNDRGYQRGDLLRLREWHPADSGCDCNDFCYPGEHWAECHEVVEKRVSYVYAGEIGGLLDGFVVLGLGDPS